MDVSQSSIGIELLRLTLKCRDIDKRLSARCTLTVDEMHCLAVIYAERPACVKQLSEYLNTDATRTSKLLCSLDRRGLLTRSLDLDDRRKEQITLSEAGLYAVERIVALYGGVANRLLGTAPSEWSSFCKRFVETLSIDGVESDEPPPQAYEDNQP